ncbi:hypothetical protein GCK32_018560, partial [Trichostrongylus colubriformis]
FKWFSGYQVRIRGGKEVKPNTLPWIAAIFSEDASGTIHFCSAVQISRRHILTAAHCVVNTNKLQPTECKSHRPFNTKQRILPNLTYELRNKLDVYVTSTHTGRLHFGNRSDLVKMEIEGLPHVHEGFGLCTENDLALIELKSSVPREVGSPICMRENEELADMLTSAGYGKD